MACGRAGPCCALQAVKLAIYVAIVMSWQGRHAAVAARIKQGIVREVPTCAGRCGQSWVADASTAGGFCHCDYWCNNRNDCCGGITSKDEHCPHLQPTTDKERLTTCTGASPASSHNASAAYRPGMCWCDVHCADAGDCCPFCPFCQRADPDAQTTRRMRIGSTAAAQAVSAADAADAAELADDAEFAAQLAAESAAAAAVAPAHDCGAARPPPRQRPQAVVEGEDVFSIASYSPLQLGVAQLGPQSMTLLEAERMMLDCQAADAGPPATPIVVPVHWTAGRVCRRSSRRSGRNSGGSRCVGGSYSPALVRQQIAYMNHVYAHAGIQFTWDGVIHVATAFSAKDIAVCLDPDGECWICRQQRHGTGLAINVVTSPVHISNSALGVTLYPSYIMAGELPMCANWVFIFEKTLPNQGGRSLVDNELADSGSVLAHEVGHQLMLHHTWYEEANPRGPPPVSWQCERSASMDPVDILAARSDGVRDTPAQSLNGTKNPVTDILRFIGCDPDTGHYTNSSEYAQQSCHSGTGFPAGDGYYNNYNNLMSYGDRYCLRTLTPGQGARARCAVKCMRMGRC